MKAQPSSPTPCDQALQQALEAWRQQHKLREDDAVLLMMQLLKIHQQHWMALWAKQLPSFEVLEKEILTLTSLNKALQKQTLVLSTKLTRVSKDKGKLNVSLSAACLASLACILGGYIWGKGIL